MITRDDKGKQCEGRENVAAVLTGLKSSTVLEGKVTGKGDGTYYVHFKQKTAYEISACLVGSEMCIRDSHS